MAPLPTPPIDAQEGSSDSILRTIPSLIKSSGLEEDSSDSILRTLPSLIKSSGLEEDSSDSILRTLPSIKEEDSSDSILRTLPSIKSETAYFAIDDEDGPYEEDGEDTSQEYALLDFHPGISLLPVPAISFTSSCAFSPRGIGATMLSVIVITIGIAYLWWRDLEAAALNARTTSGNAATSGDSCFVGADLDGVESLLLRRSTGETVSVALQTSAQDSPSSSAPFEVRQRETDASANAAFDTLHAESESKVPYAHGNKDGARSGDVNAIAVNVVSPATELAPERRHDDDGFPDLTCKDARHKEWHEVKSLTAQLFDQWDDGNIPHTDQQLSDLVSTIGDMLSTVSADIDECNMGRICMSLLAVIAAANSGETLVDATSIHSPLMTVLLDIPWGIVVRSGWPIFGLLAQIHLRRQPGSDGPINEVPSQSEDAANQKQLLIDFFQTLHFGLLQRNPSTLVEYASGFLFAQNEAIESGRSEVPVMPALCAMASHLLGEIEANAQQDAFDLALGHVQGFFRAEVQSVGDLQTTVDSAWPLYSILHAASV